MPSQVRPSSSAGRFASLAILLAVASATSVGAAEGNATNAGSASDLSELSLQELTNIEVTSLSRRPQLASQAAAAIFVLTQDDIRRAGATSIPEALRLVPGLQVVQIDANKWAISARGFAGRFANKLLVLMDGRTLYTPSFGGVHWDTHDTLIDDIERIEVIRGPAGTVWGTNAVNGIINIISKHSDQTGGFLASGEVSDARSVVAAARVGSADSDSTRWRAFARYSSQGDNTQPNGTDAYDGWQQARVGGRLDTTLNNRDTVRAAMEAYTGHSGDSLSGTILTPLQNPLMPALRSTTNVEGAWASASYSHNTAEDARIETQLYVDHSNRYGSVFSERRDTVDAELQHALSQIGSNKIIWGANLRYTSGELALGNTAAISPPDYTMWLGSLYLQDEYTLNDSTALTAGLRVEDASLGGTAVLPNFRVKYAVTSNSTLWAAIARGQRRPSRAESRFNMPNLFGPIPPGTASNPFPLPLTVGVVGDNDFGSENLWAYEAGARWQPLASFSIDLAAFYNDYSGLRGGADGAPTCLPSEQSVLANPACLFTSTGIRVVRTLRNQFDGAAYGGELVARWSPVSNWRVTATYAHLHKQIEGITGTDPTILFTTGEDPEHEYSLRSTLSIGPRWDWDLFIKHHSEIPYANLESHTHVDTRLAWRVTLDFELALAGKNLWSPEHVEALSEFTDLMPTAIRRSVLLQARWSTR